MSEGRDSSTAIPVEELFWVVCFPVLVLIVLYEQYAQVPAALVAFAAAWRIIRLQPPRQA